MGFEKSFDEKIDVIDLIINVLKDHESKLDELVSRLESAPTITKKEKSSEPSIEDYSIRNNEGFRHYGQVVTAILEKWADFRYKGKNSDIVTFETIDGIFKVSALRDGIIYVYQEDIPHMGITYREDDNGAQVEGIDINKPGLMPIALREKLDCGLEFTRRDFQTEMDDGRTVHQIKFEINPDIAKSWIAYQLGIDDSMVVLGKLQK